jgi:hypothetical protein
LLKVKKTDGEIVDTLYTAALARLPAEAERNLAIKYLSGAKVREEGCRDLVWALINTKEFLTLHSAKVTPELVQEINQTVDKVWGKGTSEPRP